MIDALRKRITFGKFTAYCHNLVTLPPSSNKPQFTLANFGTAYRH